jgi:hypothetical protein
LGGGEGGASTCKTSSCFKATVEFTVSGGAEISTGSGNTYTLLLTSDAPSVWQQDMLHATIPAPRGCSHSISFFVASFFPGELVFPCPCTAHIFPAQHAAPRAIQADAHIGVHNSNTAIRHTDAPAVLPGAIGAWSERLIGELREYLNRFPVSIPVLFRLSRLVQRHVPREANFFLTPSLGIGFLPLLSLCLKTRCLQARSSFSSSGSSVPALFMATPLRNASILCPRKSCGWKRVLSIRPSRRFCSKVGSLPSGASPKLTAKFASIASLPRNLQ